MTILWSAVTSPLITGYTCRIGLSMDGGGRGAELGGARQPWWVATLVGGWVGKVVIYPMNEQRATGNEQRVTSKVVYHL
jgi:hypothetical protein